MNVLNGPVKTDGQEELLLKAVNVAIVALRPQVMAAYTAESLIAATSDIHSPRYLALLREALSSYKGEPCLLILAGDLIDKGRIAFMEPLVKQVKSKFQGVKLVAVFGNEEYHEVRDVLRRRYNSIIWLDDEYTVVECNSKKIAIVGTSGALDRPTSWQRRNMPWIERIYKERPVKVGELIEKARSKSDYVILVSHYALSKQTILGEPPRIWPELYSRSMESLIAEKRPDAAIHGHAHNGTRKALVAGVPIYNVALPLNRALVNIRLKSGLDLFLKRKNK